MHGTELKGWGFLSPTLVVLGFVGIFPFVYVLYLSLFYYNIFSLRGIVYVGINNFRKLMNDPKFMSALSKGLLFVVVTCGVEITLGLAIALLLSKKFVGRGVLRTIMTLPLAMAPVAIGSMWIVITRPAVGPVSYWLGKLGISYDISESALQAFFTTVIMDVWHWTPFVILAFLAGLTSLPQEPMEAARVDGAGPWQTFRHVIFPLMRPILVTIVFIRIMDTFRIYDEVWALTSGGPGTATKYVSIHLVRLVLARQEYGYGASMSVFLLYLTIVMCWVLMNLITRVKKEVYAE